MFSAFAAHTKSAHKQPGLEGPARSTSQRKGTAQFFPNLGPLDPLFSVRRHPRLLAPPSSVRISQAASAPLAPPQSPLWSAAAWSLPARRLGPSQQLAAGQPSNPLSRRLGSKSPQAGRLPAGSGTICSAPGPTMLGRLGTLVLNLLRQRVERT